MPPSLGKLGVTTITASPSSALTTMLYLSYAFTFQIFHLFKVHRKKDWQSNPPCSDIEASTSSSLIHFSLSIAITFIFLLPLHYRGVKKEPKITQSKDLASKHL